MLQVDFNKWWEGCDTWLRHDICVYKEKDGSWYSIDIYFHNSRANPIGPFNSINEVADQLPSHYGATDWNSYNIFTSSGKLVETVVK